LRRVGPAIASAASRAARTAPCRPKPQCCGTHNYLDTYRYPGARRVDLSRVLSHWDEERAFKPDGDFISSFDLLGDAFGEYPNIVSNIIASARKRSRPTELVCRDGTNVGAKYR
ncbi:MAG: hypothetical protein WAK53_05700, partial [Chromatiaceae bacterium]